MEKDKEKIKEPYKPEDTPHPPQQIDPDTERQRENPVEEKGRASREPENKKKKKGKSENARLLNEDAQIDDEATI